MRLFYSVNWLVTVCMVQLPVEEDFSVNQHENNASETHKTSTEHPVYDEMTLPSFDCTLLGGMWLYFEVLYQ